MDVGFDLASLLASAHDLTLVVVERILHNVATWSKQYCIASLIASFGSKVRSSLVISSSTRLIVLGSSSVENNGVVMLSFIASI